MRAFVIIAALSAALLAVADRVEAADAKKSKSVIPVFRLRGPIVETPEEENILFGQTHSIALKDLTERMTKAGADEDVKAVVVTFDGGSVSLSQAEEVSQAIAALRGAGKEVHLFADGLTMQDYVLASSATEISLVPTGDLWLTGYYASSPYLRTLLDSIGVTPDFLHCGDYKSASEIFMRQGPSPEAEEMQNWLLDSLYQTTIRMIAKGRTVEEAKVRTWIDGGPYTASRAKELGIIDHVQQRHELQESLAKKFGEQVKFDHKYGAKASSQPDLSSPMGIMNFYAELLGGGKRKKVHKESVAIVYVEGPIMLGESDSNPLASSSKTATSAALRKALDEAATDDTIKAVVLRVDSPGGSATASDIILAATERVKAKKPLVVSMGNVAGSGGYYVACGSDIVFADESTITGSIGVVGGKMATTAMWNKIGIHWKEYGRGDNASILSSAHPFTNPQRERMQGWMDEIYGVFKDHVVEIRGAKLKKGIDELAGGRVYTGRQALELGLVDRIGTLHDAVKQAAELAKIEKYETRVVPEPKNFIEQLLSGASGDDDAKGVSIGAMAAPQYPMLDAVLPYLRQFDGERVNAVVMALGRLELIRREGVVLMMPEIVIGNQGLKP